LNKSGLYIVLQFVLNPDTFFSRKELIKLTGMSRQTVDRSIGELVKYSILEEKDEFYSLNRTMVMFSCDCDDIAAITGKSGRYEFYRDLYNWERYIYTGVHLKYRIEKNIDITLNELLVLEIIKNSLTRSTRLYPDPSIGSSIVMVPKKEGVIYV
jgi:biotin operon repressor